MIELLQLPQFWICLGTVITAAFTYAKYRAKLNFMYTMKSETFKNNNQMQALALLSKVLEDIKPMIERHEQCIAKLEKSISHMGIVYSDMTGMMATLKTQYVGFEKRMSTVTEGAGFVMTKLKNMETEIITIKDDLILVRTKK